MLDMFEKLINEHGSSVILKERIKLINDKYEAIETKLENTVKENEVLKKGSCAWTGTYVCEWQLG